MLYALPSQFICNAKLKSNENKRYCIRLNIKIERKKKILQVYLGCSIKIYRLYQIAITCFPYIEYTRIRWCENFQVPLDQQHNSMYCILFFFILLSQFDFFLLLRSFNYGIIINCSGKTLHYFENQLEHRFSLKL